MRIKKLLPLIATSVACFALSFALVGKTDKAVAETTGDTSLSTFTMYNGAQILASGEYGGADSDKLPTSKVDGMRFMATLSVADYWAIEEKYGDKAVETGDAKEDTTEWGMLFTTKAKADAYELNEANVFNKDTHVYYWLANTNDDVTWHTDEVGTKKPATNATTMFTPVRYDDLSMSWYSDGRLINDDRSLDGQTLGDYCVLSAYIQLSGESAWKTELTARAYVTYIDEKGQRVYKFADYADGDIENNSRSMTYLAQKYIDRDAEKFESKVEKYIVNMNVGFTIEYHFVDVDGKSIMYSKTVSPSGNEWPHQTGDTLQMTVSEIVDMSGEQTLLDLADAYDARIDWYNPYKVSVSTAYANDRTTFRLYYANESYANSVDSYDILATMSERDEEGSVKSWYEDGTPEGTDDLSDYQFDKKYTLFGDEYHKTYCTEHDEAGGCIHVCDKTNCNNPKHGHCSQLLTTKLYNNTLQINATLWDNTLNNGEGGWSDMALDDQGNVVSGLNFADYEYILIRFHSNIGGMKMAMIAGSTTSNGQTSVVTTGEWYEIKAGWNRIAISGEAIQKTIKDYAKTDAIMDDVKDDEDRIITPASYAPYRNRQYLQFIVDDDTYYTENVPASAQSAVDWTLHFEDIVGVKERAEVKEIDNGGFEDDDTLANIGAANFDLSLNTDAQFTFKGNQSLKLQDKRRELGVDEQKGWANVKLFLKMDGKPITFAELVQMEISFELYTTSELILWFAECVWTDAAPIKVNAWNTIRMSGWRMVDAVEKFVLPYGYDSGYDPETGAIQLAFAGMKYDTTLYIDNLQANYVTPKDQVVELDEFTQLPGRTEKLTAPTWIHNVYGSDPNAKYDEATDTTDILFITDAKYLSNIPYWSAIPEETNNTSENVVYSYEVMLNNELVSYILVDGLGYVTSLNGSVFYQGSALDSYSVRAKEVTTTDGTTVTRYSDWVDYVWNDNISDKENFNPYTGVGYNVVAEVAGEDGYFWWQYTQDYKAYQQLQGNTIIFETPNVTISEKGIASWDMVEGAFAYAILINNEWKTVNGNEEPTISWLQKRQIALNPGDSISVRAVTQHRRDEKGNYLKADGSVVTEKTTDASGNLVVDTSKAQIIYAGAWSMPQTYNPTVIGKITTQTVNIHDQEGNVIGTEQRESGETIYDVGAARGDVFWETSRIVSPVSGSDYAWKFVLGDKQSSGIMLLPLNISGQPLTNSQLLAADYIEISVYAGESNSVEGTFRFNGEVPPVGESTLKPGQWNVVRIPTLEMYKIIQQYITDTASRDLLDIQNPYSNGYSPLSPKPLSRLCGYAVFEVANAKAGDYWIIDSARLVYDEDSPTYASSASYWFTQHDYDTMPITAYNALPPKTTNDSSFYDTTIEDLEARIDELSRQMAELEENSSEWLKLNTEKKSLQDTVTNINNTVESLRKYENLDYDTLIQKYVDCGINTMMGLYDYANYSTEGHDFAVEMLKKCAENDLAYLLAWSGSTSLTPELLTSEQGKIMKKWLVEYMSYGALAGIMLCDEPGAVLFDNIAVSKDAFKEFLGEDYLYHANLLPNWTSKNGIINSKNDTMEPWWDAEPYGYTYDYAKYIDEYIRMYQPKVLSFDVYPIVGRNDETKVLNGVDNVDESVMTRWFYTNGTMSKSNTISTEGSYSELFVMPAGTYMNIMLTEWGQPEDAKAVLAKYNKIAIDIYSDTEETLRLLNEETRTLAAGQWTTLTFTSEEWVDILSVSGTYNYYQMYILVDDTDGATLYIDNIRGIIEGETRYLRKGYYQNLATIRDASIKANIPFWTYIQTCSWHEGGRLPTENELRWNVNTSLAYGAKGIQYFCGVVPYSSGGETFDGALFDGAGVPTLLYNYVKTMNKQIKGIDHILMNSRNLGVVYAGGLPQFYTVNSDSSYTQLTAEENALEKPTLGTLTAQEAGLVSVDVIQGNILIGCFDYNGKTAYYVVNNSTTSLAHVDLKFGETPYGHPMTVYGAANSVGWIQHLLAGEEDNLEEMTSTYATGIPATVDGMKMTTNDEDRLSLRNLMAGEAVLVVMD
ncbi:MAG: hypothetical protein E7368_00505 [Clostridiales bacterium]|nr:hypothetical protein [Clostridiales bacterium]